MKIIYLATLVIWLSAETVFGQANVFTYQGQLRSAGTPVTNGVVFMTFQLMGRPPVPITWVTRSAPTWE